MDGRALGEQCEGLKLATKGEEKRIREGSSLNGYSKR